MIASARASLRRPWRARLLLGAALLAALPPGVAGDARTSRPNILFIVTDDQGPWALGAAGESQAITPTMDRLAREGARFTQAFSPTPVCSPARASIMTGRYGTEFGITDHIFQRVEPNLGLDPAVPTWPRLLQQAGYATALFGKWHLGGMPEFHPTRHGYGTFVGFPAGSIRPRDPTLEKDGAAAKREGMAVDLLTDESIAWMERRDPRRPFALSLHYREPHAPYLPVRDEDWAVVAGLQVALREPEFPGLDTARAERLMREYLAAVAALDRCLARLLAALVRLDLDRDTVVIYTSDHGYNLGHHGLHFKGNAQWDLLKPEALPPGTVNVPAIQRPNLFDTSVKVPLLVRWPGVIQPGRVISRTVSHLDWFPTLLELAGVPPPRDSKVRGRTLVPLFKADVPGWDDSLYAEYSMKHGATAHLRMWRTPEWKLIRDFANSERDELYRLADDPEEKRNLIHESHPEVRRERDLLDDRIRLRMATLRDPITHRPIASRD